MRLNSLNSIKPSGASSALKNALPLAPDRHPRGSMPLNSLSSIKNSLSTSALKSALGIAEALPPQGFGVPMTDDRAPAPPPPQGGVLMTDDRAPTPPGSVPGSGRWRFRVPRPTSSPTTSPNTTTNSNAADAARAASSDPPAPVGRPLVVPRTPTGPSTETRDQIYARWQAAIARRAHPALIDAIARRYGERLAMESATAAAATASAIADVPAPKTRPTLLTLAVVTVPLWGSLLLFRP